MITHGMSKTPLYSIWAQMRSRINNENHKKYKSYGDRGISICDEWKDSPIKFVEWGMKNGYKKGLLLDRKDNDGNYCAGNCRFVTPAQSSHNTRLLSSNNTSGYRGVSYNKVAKKWQVHIRINNKHFNLGIFNSKVLAALRWDAEAYRLNDGRPMNFMINHPR